MLDFNFPSYAFSIVVNCSILPPQLLIFAYNLCLVYLNFLDKVLVESFNLFCETGFKIQEHMVKWYEADAQRLHPVTRLKAMRGWVVETFLI